MSTRNTVNNPPAQRSVATVADLWNAAGSPNTTPALQVGDACYVAGTVNALYVCTSAGVGTATWILGGVPVATTTAAGLMSAADKALVNLLNFGAGTPEAAVTATVGDVYMDTTNGKLYVKVTGTGNTGWRGVSPSVSGTWTPTCTITTNLASVTPSAGQYVYIGGFVHCSVRITIDPTATGVTRFRATLPIASALANVGELTGGAFNINAGPNQIFADTANDEADIQSVASITSAYDLACVFSYRVL